MCPGDGGVVAAVSESFKWYRQNMRPGDGGAAVTKMYATALQNSCARPWSVYFINHARYLNIMKRIFLYSRENIDSAWSENTSIKGVILISIVMSVARQRFT